MPYVVCGGTRRMARATPHPVAMPTYPVGSYVLRNLSHARSAADNTYLERLTREAFLTPYV